MKSMRLLCLSVAGTVIALAACSEPGAQSSDTIRQYVFAATGETYALELQEVPMPVAGPDEVLVRVHASSLNRRDWSMLNARYGQRGNLAGTIPLSDGAGEVIAVGSEVTEWEVGDRVAGTFFSDWRGGKFSPEAFASARGGSPWGMLAEVVVTKPVGLVEIPDYLSFEEAAALPCAAVTAWNGLFKAGDLQSGDYVLLEGTGGVSTFGLQLAAAAGARAIITSSSNDKLAKARELGAAGTVNYRENAEWQDAVRELTDDAGVDHVLEIGGRDTLERAIQALAFDGHVALIGGLTGPAPPINMGDLVLRGATATGIYVGSRADFEDMLAFMEEHEIRPLIDRTFTFDQAQEAFDFMGNGSYMGKIVITH